MYGCINFAVSWFSHKFLHFSRRMELEVSVAALHSFFGLVSILKLSEEEGYAAFNEETAFALSSVQDIPLSRLEVLLFHKDLSGSASPHYLGSRVLDHDSRNACLM